jgi:hypothetical protein
MAGDWIKWAKGFARKREIILIAARLQLDRRIVATAMMELFEWVEENLKTDNEDVVTLLSRSERDTCHAPVTDDRAELPASDDAVVYLGASALRLLDDIVGVQGFADAMTAVGWLRQRSGSLVFPNFLRHNGLPSKARANAALRQQRSRAKLSAEKSVTKPSRSERDKSVTREEKSIKKTSSSSGSSPDTAPIDLPDKPKPPPNRATADALTAPSPGDELPASAAQPPPKPVSGTASARGGRRLPDSPHHRSLRRFLDGWRGRYGCDYPLAGAKDGAAVEWMLRSAGGEEQLAGAIDRYLASDDEFAGKNRHDIGTLRAQFARWLVPPATPKPARPAPANNEAVIQRILAADKQVGPPLTPKTRPESHE